MSLEEWLKQSPTFFQGKKTYIVAAVACLLGFLEAFGLWTVPEYLWPLLGAIGLGCLRSGVNGVKGSLKDIALDKKVILLAALLLLMTGGPLRANGLTLWGITEQDIDSPNNSITGRIGYEYDYIEAILGSTWRPNYDNETGEVKPPQIFSLGFLVHIRDLLDPNNPLPWLPEILLTLIPEKMVARPYVGVIGSMNILDQDGGHTGFPVGLLCQQNIADRSAFVVEASLFNQYFGDLSAVPDDKWNLYFGFRYYFGK